MPHCRNQPEVCQWNCAQLANALLAAELVGKEDAEGVLKEFSEVSVLAASPFAGARPCLHGVDDYGFALRALHALGHYSIVTPRCTAPKAGLLIAPHPCMADSHDRVQRPYGREDGPAVLRQGACYGAASSHV